MSSAVLNFRQIQVVCKLIGFSLCLGLFSILSTSAIATALTAPLMAQAQPSEVTNPVANKLLGQWQVKDPSSAKLPELRSYIGAVFVINVRSDSITVRGICETNQPSSTPPAMPKPPSNPERQIQCANGSHSIQR